MANLLKRMTLLIGLVISILVWAEENSIQYFMRKVNTRAFQLNPKEKSELLSQLEILLGRVEEVHQRLVYGIHSGGIELRYQEGKYWISQLEKDQEWMKIAHEQIKILKNHPNHLLAAIELYRSLKHLSFDFNAYNNHSFFSASVGDLAPEIELWVDPIFYQLYLLPLAHSKEKRIETPSKGGKSTPKPKGP